MTEPLDIDRLAIRLAEQDRMAVTTARRRGTRDLKGASA